MRAFLRTSSGEARDPASSVEPPAENSAPSSGEQPAETFTSIAAVNRWLTVQGAACNTPDFQKLRAAVSVLTKTPNPRQEEVLPLCSSWSVRQKDQRRRRPLATLITELQQAVITEGSRLRASLDGQTGAPASSAEQPAAFPGAASNAEQPAVAGCAGKRPLDSVTAAQPGIPTKRQRVTSIVDILRGHPQNSDSSAGAAQPGSQQAGAAASSTSTLPGRMESNAGAAQPGPPTKQQRLTAIAAGISSLQGDVDTNTSTAQPGAAATAAAPLAARAEHIQRSILQYGSGADDLAELRRAMVQKAQELRRLKRETAADDDGSEALTKLLRQANQLQHVPATKRTLE